MGPKSKVIDVLCLEKKMMQLSKVLEHLSHFGQDIITVIMEPRFMNKPPMQYNMEKCAEEEFGDASW